MIFEIILLSIISIFISYVRNKEFKFYNNQTEIKGCYVFIAMAAISIIAQFLYKNFSQNYLIKILSLRWTIYFTLLIVSLINFKKPFMKLMFIGTLMNFIVIVSNGFKMPVLVSDVLSDVETKKMYLLTGKDLVHSLLTEQTKFKFLADIITLPHPYPFPKTLSIGDLFLLAGFFMFWQ